MEVSVFVEEVLGGSVVVVVVVVVVVDMSHCTLRLWLLWLLLLLRFESRIDGPGKGERWLANARVVTAPVAAVVPVAPPELALLLLLVLVVVPALSLILLVRHMALNFLATSVGYAVRSY